MSPFVSVHQRVAAHAAALPDAIAVCCNGESITYGQLNRRANQLARRLQRAGAARDQLIAIGMDRSIDMVVGLLAILKAGGAYLPIDLDYPMERLEFTIGDALPVALLTTSASAAAMPKSAAPVILVDDASLALEDASDVGSADPDALAYVIYTSGSTGRPKGCLVTHRNVARLFDATDAWYRFGPDDVWPLFHSHAFDVSVWELWGALGNGGRLVVVPYLTTRSPDEFLALLVREGVTVLNQTPSAFRPLIEADRRAKLPPDALRLRVVIFAGEPLSFEMLRPWFERHGDRRPVMVNMYGITETTVHVSYRPVSWQDLELRRGSMIGCPIPDLRMHLLNEQLQPVTDGEIAEIVVSGPGVANGYLHRPDLTAQRFIDWIDPATGQAVRAYRSGDLGKRHPDGDIECLGRMDHQVKIRGFRIETGEIENLLLRHPGVRECAVIARTDHADGEARLVAYLVPAASTVPASALRTHLAKDLPQFMLPAAFVEMKVLPITENGKLDRRALPEPPRERPDLTVAYREPSSALERRVCQAFTEVLDIDRSGLDDNFFELGGTSLLVTRLLTMLEGAGARTLGVPDFFADPTPSALVRALDEPAPAAPLAAPAASARAAGERAAVAIVGMAGRFPGAADLEQFWDNLCAGRESITFFDDATLDAGVSAALRADPAYVRARGIIDDPEMFDAAFFGINPKEAELMDPQQRIFLELCWECMERAGYAPDSCPVPVGVYAGMYSSTYFQRHVQSRPDLIEPLGEFQVTLGNDKDYVATRVAHRLNLTGPAISIHTACSTSLVAVAQAFSALRNGDCDMALAGAAAVTCPPRSGYLHQEGAMLSPDGHTRSFDARAQGTVFSDGAAVVLLKRLSDALADGDTIHAVLRGAAINNDGGVKASFTAPSIDGQARVVSAALASAGVDARSISYVETHGTATPMGDPIEIAALAKAYAAHTRDTGFCAVGSVKSNIGHLVAAAGATGLIKTALSLREQTLPASLHFEAPNASIDFAATPFRVNDRLQAWPRSSAAPRRAGVSSFGVGGTNAHVIVEEAPLQQACETVSGPRLLKLSARTPSALAAAARRLADHLETHPDLSLADVAHTLHVGRKAFARRCCVIAGSTAEAVASLRSDDPLRKVVGETSPWVPSAVFMFPGQGAQYAGMSRQLHAQESQFRGAMDECLQALEGAVDFDLRERMFSDDDEALKPTSVTQPATFVLEYALARQLQALGVKPAALIGHSVGEFVAAVLAGVMSLRDAVRLVAQRGALMQARPAGSMLSVRLSEAELAGSLPEGLSIAADNGPTACVAAGPTPSIEAFRQRLEADGVAAKLLQTSHAFHSAMMAEAVAPFEALVRAVPLAPPTLPIYSTLTGRLLTAAEATDPAYWSRHLRETVRFSPALQAALEQIDHPLFIEVGPRSTLATLVRQHASRQRTIPAVSLLSDRPDHECASWRLAAGRLWTLGLEPALAVLDPRPRKLRVQLPSYPFERKRFWIDIAAPIAAASVPSPATSSPSLPITAIPDTPAMTIAAPSPELRPDRRGVLVARLRELFEDISGLDMAQAPSDAAFVELGLDSLTLTQAALQVKKQFKANLSFRQLMERYRSFDALAGFLDETLPSEPSPPAPVAPAPVAAAMATTVAVAAQATPIATPAVGLASGKGTLLQQVIAQQMQLMQQQLALLSAAPQVPASPVLPASVVEQTTPLATAAATASTPTEPDAEEPLAAPKYDVKKAFGAIARIHTQSKEPTERQRARLAAFIRRYTERTARSKTFTERNRGHMADPRVVNGFRPATKEITYQIVVDRSKGSRLWDIDGNEYVDVLNGFGMNLFGWQPDFINAALHKQLDLGYEIGPQHPLAAEITRLVCEMTGFDRAGLCNTGSEAVMAAIRIARTATGRSTVAVFSGSYHGTFDEVLVRAGRNHKGMSAAPGVMQGMFGDIRVLDYGTPEALEFIRANADDLAAVLVEPVQSRRPDFQPREFLREVRAITEKSETCLIFDEVITGFRCHLGGAQAVFGIRADLACYGKVIGGGLPVGVIAGKRAFMDALDGGAWQYGDDSVPTVGVTYFAGTFVRHPLALAAAKAALDHLKQDDNKLQTQLNLHTAAMADELSAFCREAGAPVEIRYFSSLWRVSWLEDHPLQDLLFAMMRSRGVHILDNFPCFMTTAHTQQDIATIKSAFKESIAEMQEAELLPRRAAGRPDLDPSQPPVPNARLGRDRDGQPAWFVPDPAARGKYTRFQA